MSSLQDRMYCTLDGGQKISMPRYYKDKIYHLEQRKAIGVYSRQEQLKRLDQEALDQDSGRKKFQSHKAAFDKMARDKHKNEKI